MSHEKEPSEETEPQDNRLIYSIWVKQGQTHKPIGAVRANDEEEARSFAIAKVEGRGYDPERTPFKVLA